VRSPCSPSALASTDERLARLEAYARLLPDAFTAVNARLVQLDAVTKRAVGTVDEADARVQASADFGIEQFSAHLDGRQARDIRIAGIGMLITAVGIVLLALKGHSPSTAVPARLQQRSTVPKRVPKSGTIPPGTGKVRWRTKHISSCDNIASAESSKPR
jgi:hypothetical protein